jgi:hypothetical protein
MIVLKNMSPTYYSCRSSGTLHINLKIMKGHFRRISQISTVPVPIVLSIDTPTQMEPSFMSEKCKFWVKNSIMYCPQKPVTWIYLILYGCRCKFPATLYTVVFETCACWANYARDLQGKCPNMAAVLWSFFLVNTTFCLVYFLCKKEPV